MAQSELPILDETALTEWVVGQRWFGAKARDIAHLGVMGAIPVCTEEPLLAVALVEARFGAGTHELYQVLLGGRPREQGWSEGVIGTAGDWTLYDALTDPRQTALIGRLLRDEGSCEGGVGTVRFHWTGEGERIAPDPEVRSVGAEQSNSSVVFDERYVLKVFRRVEPGDNPELEMLRFLSSRGFPNIAALAGFYEYAGEVMSATLGVLQDFVAAARDGWELTLERVGEPELLEQLAALGRVVAEMHNALASDATHPDFAPEEPGEEALALLVATIDEEIERVFVGLPELEALEPIRNRGEEVRDRLQLLSHVGIGGRLIRHHGDLHLGQTLLGADGRWVILDFEGEPARPLLERRRKRSPLRDVAGMLRSFAYAASAGAQGHGREAPEGWEQDARSAFLGAYLEAIEPALLPAGEAGVARLLSIFELEKAVYELRYELNNRPDWVAIPAAGIARLLEEPLS